MIVQFAVIVDFKRVRERELGHRPLGRHGFIDDHHDTGDRAVVGQAILGNPDLVSLLEFVRDVVGDRRLTDAGGVDAGGLLVDLLDPRIDVLQNPVHVGRALLEETLPEIRRIVVSTH